jgi:hypothetical protein
MNGLAITGVVAIAGFLYMFWSITPPSQSQIDKYYAKQEKEHPEWFVSG